MLKLAPAGPAKQNSVDGHGELMGVAVARTSWRTSFAVSGAAMSARCAAALPSAMTSAATPALVGVPVEVEPSLLGTEDVAPAVGGEDDGLGDAIGSVDGLVAGLDRNVAAEWAHPDAVEAVFALPHQLGRLTGEVPVDALFGLRVVVVAIEVPAIDV